MISPPKNQRLFVCYLPGIDLRRIDGERAPYLAMLLKAHPWASLRTYPSPELLSTVITGQEPHEHGIWQTTLLPISIAGIGVLLYMLQNYGVPET